VRGEFGYWVFEGDTVPQQRPSWNYRKEEDGGMILDMFAHWRYVIDNLFGKVKSVSCLGATHIKERCDESGKPYKLPPPTTPPTAPSSWRTGSSATSTRPGSPASAATTC
jgi:predicted dehydrogenase